MESESMLAPREKSPLPEAQRRVEHATLHYAGQRAKHTTEWAIPAPNACQYESSDTISKTAVINLNYTKLTLR